MRYDTIEKHSAWNGLSKYAGDDMFGVAGKVVICIVLLAFVAGCTTMRALPSNDAQSITSQLTVGDEVQITRIDASVVRFKVDAISDEGLAGDGVFVAYSDIQQVRVKEFSAVKTVGLVVTILVIVKGLYDYTDAVTTLAGGL
jgi:hypothetical protein